MCVCSSQRGFLCTLACCMLQVAKPLLAVDTFVHWHCCYFSFKLRSCQALSLGHTLYTFSPVSWLLALVLYWLHVLLRHVSFIVACNCPIVQQAAWQPQPATVCTAQQRLTKHLAWRPVSQPTVHCMRAAAGFVVAYSIKSRRNAKRRFFYFISFFVASFCLLPVNWLGSAFLSWLCSYIVPICKYM